MAATGTGRALGYRVQLAGGGDGVFAAAATGVLTTRTSIVPMAMRDPAFPRCRPPGSAGRPSVTRGAPGGGAIFGRAAGSAGAGPAPGRFATGTRSATGATTFAGGAIALAGASGWRSGAMRGARTLTVSGQDTGMGSALIAGGSPAEGRSEADGGRSFSRIGGTWAVERAASGGTTLSSAPDDAAVYGRGTGNGRKSGG